MAMKVKDVADMAGVSVRTLHYYDRIGLLIPSAKTAAGYRLYSDDDLDKLQQILFFKTLAFPLVTIKNIMLDPEFNTIEALQIQRNMLLEKQQHLQKIIAVIDQTLQHEKGEMTMTYEEKFAGFDFSHNPYEQEARQRWGDASVDTAEQTVNAMSTAEREDFQTKFNHIYRELAAIRHKTADSEDAQAGIAKWYQLLNQMGDYSPAAFQSLGQMYVEDERFKENIDQFGEGLAVFMRDAMQIYAQQHS